MSRITVSANGLLGVETQGWSSYWTPLQRLGSTELNEALDHLRFAWSNYILSGFTAELRREFCFRYFFLLNSLSLKRRYWETSKAWKDAVRSVLGFECFGVAGDSSPEPLAAATCSLRNPCYLLAKLKMPEAPDDTQFLPLITLSSTQEVKLFFHYRQYTLSFSSPMSLFVYPAAAIEDRAASLRLVGTLENGLRQSADPWTPERAKHLYAGVIRPLLDSHMPDGSGKLEVEFVDVGAGSGSLMSAICRQVLQSSAFDAFRIRVWSVDIQPFDPIRFYRALGLRESVDTLASIGADYRDWLSTSTVLPPKRGPRVALLSKVLDTSGQFSVQAVPRSQFGPAHSAHEPPHCCLSETGKGPEALGISNARMHTHAGRGYALRSLSPFYGTMSSFLCEEPPEHGSRAEDFLPTRTFNHVSLVTSHGGSVIAHLSGQCDYVLIEDADLAPPDVVAHMGRFSLHSLAVLDMTRSLRLKGNHLYLVCDTSRSPRLDCQGERIW